MSYQGNIIEIPVGTDGLTGTKNLSQAQAGQLLTALNVSYERGTVTKEGGSSKYNSSAITGTPTVLGGWDWWSDTSTQRMVVGTSDGKLLKDSGAGTFPVTLVSGLTMTNVVPVFVEGGKEAAAGNRKLFIFTGSNAVQVLSADGATTTNLSTPPADWTGATQPITGCIHEGRLWGFLGHRAYYSTPENHEDFTGPGSGQLPVYPGEGERIVASLSYKGLLVVAKAPRGIYLIDTADPSIVRWRSTPLSKTVGMMGPLCFAVIDNDVALIDAGGNFQLLSAVQEFGDLASRNLSTLAEMSAFMRDNVNLARLQYVRAAYYPEKREAHFAIAASGATTNTRRVIIDFNRPDLPRFRFSDKDTCEALWLRKDVGSVPRLTSGDTAGFVWNLDHATKSKDGSGFLAQFQTPHDDFSRADLGLATKRKLGDFIECVLEPINDTTIDVQVVWDGRVRQTVQFNASGSGVALGTFTLGTHSLVDSTEIKTVRKRMTGSGRRLSLICQNNLAGGDFSIAKFLAYFRLGDERI